MNAETPSTHDERRQHRRLEIRLPMEFSLGEAGGADRVRTVTRNVSTGGIYFETLPGDLRPGQTFRLALTVPPGDGYFPFTGQVRGEAEVVRIEPRPSPPQGHDRIGVAARFREDLKLDF